MYGGEVSEPLYARLSEIGLNTIIHKDDEFEFERVKPAIALAEKYGLHFFLTAFFRGGSEQWLGLEDNPRKFIHADGTAVANWAACPLNQDYWETAVLKRALPLAEFSKTHPLVAGFATDTENYNFQGWREYCFCDACFTEFISHAIAQGWLPADPGDMEAAKRSGWLESKALLDKYQQWQHQGVYRICKSIRERIDAVNPDFLLAALSDIGSSGIFDWDMAAGFATERAPFISMPESTYGAYGPFSFANINYYEGSTANPWREAGNVVLEAKRRGIPFMLLPGLWNEYHHAEEFATQAYLAATICDGYWMYGGAFTQVFLKRERPPFRLAGSPEQWCSALTKANKDIDRHLADPTYAPKLRVLGVRMVERQWPKELIRFSPRGAETSQGVVLRRQLWRNVGLGPWAGHFLLVKANAPGGEVSFPLPDTIAAGKYSVLLFAPRGPDYGLVQVALDGLPLGGPIDCRSAVHGFPSQFTLGEIALATGMHKIGLKVVGRAGQPGGYSFGVVGVVLRPIREGTG